MALEAGPAVAACSIVGLGGDLTNQSNVTVNCDADGIETDQQGNGGNNGVVFTVGGGAQIDGSANGVAIFLANGNTLAVNGSVTSNATLYNVNLGGNGNTVTVNAGGSINGTSLFGLNISEPSADTFNNTITVNAGGQVAGASYGIVLNASSPYFIRNNLITINQGATVSADSIGLHFFGDSRDNVIVVNGSILQAGGCGCANAIRFIGSSTGNLLTVGSTGLLKSDGDAVFFGFNADNNRITVDAGGQVTGGGGGLRFYYPANGNTITVNGSVQGTGSGSHGIYFRRNAGSNTITIGPGGLVGGVESGITFGIVEGNNRIINSGTVSGNVGINLVSGSGTNTNTIVNNAGGVIRGTGGTAIDASQDNNGGRFFVDNSGVIDGNVVFGLGDDRLTLFPGQSLLGTINGLAGNDQLVLHGTGSATFSNTIVGNSFETLVKQGDSIWTLGASQTFSGGTTVNAGALLLGVGTTLNSDVTVNGGAFGGNGTLNGGLTLNGGTLSPGASIGTLVVAGNADLRNGTTFIEVDRTSSDRLVAGGAATLTGGTVQFAFLEPVLSGSYTFINAGSVVGQFGTVTLPPSLFLGGNVSYTATTATLNLTHTAFTTAAPFENQQATAAALDRGYFGATGDAITVLGAFNSFTSVPQAADAFRQVGGEIHTSFQTTGVINAQQFAAAVRQHLRRDPIRGGGTAGGVALADASATYATSLVGNQLAMATAGERIEPVQVALGDVDPELGRARGTAWMRGFGLLGAADGKPTRASNDLGYRIAGVAGGADYAINRAFTVGVALGYANTEADLVGANHESGRTDTVSGALYGMWNRGPWYADATLGYAHDSYKTERRMTFATIDRQAEADYDGREVFFDAEAGYRLTWQGFRVEPSIGLAYANSDQSRFTERGADSLNLNGDSRSIDSVRGSIGARVAHDVRLDDGLVLVPEARLRYQREFGDDQRTLDASFAGIAGGTFTTRGAEPGRDAALVGVGVTANLDPGLAFFVAYDGDIRANAAAHAVTGGLRFTW